MNTSQPQDSVRKTEKKQEWGLDCCPSPLPAPGKLSIRPPQSKNCSAVPVQGQN